MSVLAWMRGAPPAVLRHRAGRVQRISAYSSEFMPTGMAAPEATSYAQYRRNTVIRCQRAHGVRVDDEQAAEPHTGHESAAKGNPVRARSKVSSSGGRGRIFLQHVDLLPQSDVLQHQVGAAADTSHQNGTSTPE